MSLLQVGRRPPKAAPEVPSAESFDQVHGSSSENTEVSVHCNPFGQSTTEATEMPNEVGWERLARRPSVFDKHARIRNRTVTSTFVAVLLLFCYRSQNCNSL